ncbi:MAG: alpha/beta hydrolase [bacterium]|nr:alpha/beta hydrolase [bacterium]
MHCIVDGLAVEYEDIGTGKTVVMLHGWKNNLHTFDAVTLQLSNSFRVIRIDLPGFGGSEPPPADWKLDDYVGFVKDFLAKLDIRPDILVGHSFGGRITIKGIATKVLTAKNIVLISSAGVARRKTFKNSILAVLAKIGRVVTAIPPASLWKQEIRRKLYEAIGSDYFRAGALSQTFLNIIKEDLGSFAKDISVPTLIIWGDEDDTTPIHEGKRLHQLIRGSKFQVIKGSGHFVHQEEPSKVAGIIREFVL